MSTDLLRLEHLTSGYDRMPVVCDLDLTVGCGEVVVLLGRNGSGKTTTLRAVSGLLPAMGGTISLAGQELRRRSPAARARLGIAHVPEGRGLFFGLTVAEHLRLGYRRERLDRDLAYEYFPALIGLRDRRAGLLSGGEQQMLAIGRALARRPSLLMLDELSLGLAPVVVERLLPVIRRYAAESGCGVLLVEQHVGLALEVADRGYLLSRGRVTAHQSAERLRRDRRLILASYLGEYRTHAARPGGDAGSEGESDDAGSEKKKAAP